MMRGFWFEIEASEEGPLSPLSISVSEFLSALEAQNRDIWRSPAASNHVLVQLIMEKDLKGHLV